MGVSVVVSSDTAKFKGDKSGLVSCEVQYLGWIPNKDNKQGQEEKLDGCLDHHPEERSVHSAQEVAEESSATSGRSSSPGHNSHNT